MNQPPIKYEYISGHRQNSQLLLLSEERQLFRKKNTYINDNARYVCYFKNCPVSVSLKGGQVIRSSQDVHHNHDAPTELLEKFKIMAVLKQECAQKEPEKRKAIREIFEEQCSRNEAASSVVNFDKIKRQLYRIRNTAKTKNPSTPHQIQKFFEESNNYEVYGKSKKHVDKAFYCGTITEDHFAYCLFMSPTIAELVKNQPPLGRDYVVDTFDIITSCNMQHLVVMQFLYTDHTFPFIYVLMSHTTPEAFQHLFHNINSNYFAFQPTTFYANYSLDLRFAIGTVFPTVPIKGSWYYYCHAIKQAVKRIKDFERYTKSNVKFNYWYHVFLNLPLVGVEQIKEMFSNLVKESQAYLLGNTEDCQQMFIQYFDSVWMNQITPSEFSIFLQPLKTTKTIEDFNKKLCKKIGKKIHFLKFLEIIRDEDYLYSNYLEQFLGGIVRDKDLPSVRDSKLWNLMDSLNQGSISLEVFFIHANQIISDSEFEENVSMANMNESSDFEIHELDEYENSSLYLDIKIEENPLHEETIPSDFIDVKIEPCNTEVDHTFNATNQTIHSRTEHDLLSSSKDECLEQQIIQEMQMNEEEHAAKMSQQSLEHDLRIKLLNAQISHVQSPQSSVKRARIDTESGEESLESLKKHQIMQNMQMRKEEHAAKMFQLKLEHELRVKLLYAQLNKAEQCQSYNYLPE